MTRKRLPRAKLDLSHERRLTCDPFYLVPILCDKVIPGDKIRLGVDLVIRMNPLVAPIMHEMNVYVHYYFVPFRLLWDDWENYITGGRDGKWSGQIPKINMTSVEPGSLFNHLYGMCVNQGSGTNPPAMQQLKKLPQAFPHYAYNLIHSEYYRDQNLQDETPLDWTNLQTKDMHIRCWEKDYFTSMLPWQQRGDQPAFPISGNLNAQFMSNLVVSTTPPAPNREYRLGGSASGGSIGIYDSASQTGQDRLQSYLNNNIINLENAVTFGVSELRYGFQIQRFLERMARTGARYSEFIKGTYDANPADYRLGRPEYIGGSRTPIIISEVLQTSSSDSTTPQGNMAGHGLSADRTFVANYYVQEHGLIMGIMSVMPRSLYQQGLDRVWLGESRFDEYIPDFMNLSEQGVTTAELFNEYRNPNPDEVEGFIGRYDEYRYKRNTVSGLFAKKEGGLFHWHMGRYFDTKPALNLDLVRPSLSEIQNLKRVLAVPSEDMFLITVGNKYHVTRSISWIATPGLIDH